ncbi:MAG TPA: CARDB domain-containing protein [Methanomassiliicoccales archaeon]|nr:CARDB domain-containing protein [Methanomassiliicoccales archaeon]
MRANSSWLSLAIVATLLFGLLFPAISVTAGLGPSIPGVDTDVKDVRVAVWEDLNVSAVYVAYRSGPSGYSNIYCNYSTDGGATWDTITRVNSQPTETSAQCDAPAVAMNGTGAIFVAWSEEYLGGTYVFYSRSVDQGRHFSGMQRISLTPAGNQTSPGVAIENTTIYVAWSEQNGTAMNIMVARSLDNGSTFGPPVRVDHSGTASVLHAAPQVIVQENRTFVVWQDNRVPNSLNDIYGAMSRDRGQTFTGDVLVSDGYGTTDQSRPDACFAPDGRIMVVWQDNRGEHVYDWNVRAATSSDNGSTFSRSFLVSDDPARTNSQVSPRVACDRRGIVTCVYEDYRFTTPKVMSATSSTWASFSSSARFDPAGVGTQQFLPDIVCSYNNTVFVGYDSQTPPAHHKLGFRSEYNPNIPPTVSITSPSNNANLTGEFTITGTASDPDAFDPSHPSPFQVQVMMTNDSAAVLSWTDVDIVSFPDWTYPVNASDYDNGNYTIFARSYDGLSYSDRANVSITIYNEAPKTFDLAVLASGIDFSPSSPLVGEVVNITADVLNLGNTDAHFVSVTVSIDSTLLATRNLTTVPAQGVVAIRVAWDAVIGTHNVSVMADANHSIVETNESNNLAWRSLTVTPPPVLHPDLEITPQNITFTPSTIFESDDVNISVLIYNRGEAIAFGALVNVTWEGGWLGSRTINVNPHQAALVYENWNLVPLGTHTITVRVDQNHQTGDSNYSNNVAQKTLVAEVPVINLPDLVPTAIVITPAPGTITSQDDVQFAVTISNNGTGAAFNVYVQFVLDGSELNLSRIATLDEGAAEVVSVQWTAGAAGPHTIMVKVDPSNTITESNETNNQLSREFSVRARAYYLPDLSVDRAAVVFYPSTPSVGTMCRINVTVSNIGNDTADNVKVQVKVDGVAVGGTITIPQLLPGHSQTVTVGWEPTYGAHSFNITVDGQNAITEARKDNNQVTFTLDLGPAPFNYDSLVLPLWIVAIGALAVGGYAFMRRRRRKK